MSSVRETGTVYQDLAAVPPMEAARVLTTTEKTRLLAQDPRHFNKCAAVAEVSCVSAIGVGTGIGVGCCIGGGPVTTALSAVFSCISTTCCYSLWNSCSEGVPFLSFK